MIRPQGFSLIGVMEGNTVVMEFTRKNCLLCFFCGVHVIEAGCRS